MQPGLPDRIVLGHNPFFGIDHLSSERGAQRGAHFSRPERVLEMIHVARSLGVHGMMMSTHERSASVAKLLLGDSELAQGLRVYPLLPYARKYVARANELGMVNLLFETLAGTTVSGTLRMISQGAKGILKKDLNAILGALIRLEMRPFEKLHLQAVFLHDVLTDLALGLEAADVFHFFQQEIPRLYGCHGAFATKNLPRLLGRFRRWGLGRPVVMTHFNKIGFEMNPSREECRKAAAEHDVSIMAMGTLASGYLPPDEAYAYLKQVPNVESVVVGVSSREHAESTFQAIRDHMN